MSEVNLKDIFTEAHRLIKDVGFCKGRLLYRDEGDHRHVLAYCTVGAIRTACSNLKTISGQMPDRALHCFSKAMGLLDINDDYSDKNQTKQSIPSWNDSPERTKSDVLSALNQVIYSL